jgi:hypothetical protein
MEVMESWDGIHEDEIWQEFDQKNTSIQKPEEPKNYNPAYILSTFSKERGLIN